MSTSGVDLYTDVLDDPVDLEMEEVNIKLENQGTVSVSEDLLDDVLTAPVVPIHNFKQEMDDLALEADNNNEELGESARLKAELLSKQTQEGIPAGKTSQSTSVDNSTLGISFDPNKRNAIFIGNLTWWTTDVDLVQLLKENEFQEVKAIKFFENRANGQSKGFALIELKNEETAQEAVEKLKDCVIHGQIPVLAMASKTSAHQFEQRSREASDSKGGRGPMKAGQNTMKKSTEVKAFSAPTMFPPAGPIGLQTYAGLPPPPVLSATGPLIADPSQLLPPIPPHHVPPPGLTLAGLPPPVPQVSLHAGVLGGLGGTKGLAPHVNPAFFSGAQPHVEMFSQSAIAVAESNLGNYDSAIDTLRTAISLVKQSGPDSNGNQLVIESLYERMKDIEKRYHSRSSSSSRHRGHRHDRDRDRERKRDYERDSRRDRSRSPEDPRHRSYSDRYREKERYRH
ncbi:Cleavage and polyadenylation specificity factor subunit 6-like [Oopsacas minuta]|uniref:Cleavage and polyadenylation specificity factor subunit 6-like n=1 Tax=Oopsacas minuta TaxID=111878 RepID=A0AAV7JSM7_9METZ|nr:Cleavage and polyadenylation specificity factor subunit 6-like [Oopsacas minuta]